jgi:hypothetical protein
VSSFQLDFCFWLFVLLPSHALQHTDCVCYEWHRSWHVVITLQAYKRWGRLFPCYSRQERSCEFQSCVVQHNSILEMFFDSISHTIGDMSYGGSQVVWQWVILWGVTLLCKWLLALRACHVRVVLRHRKRVGEVKYALCPLSLDHK